MAEKWLVERLTKSKQGSTQWIALAEALEEFWDTYFFANLQTLEDGKNIFTANNSHLNQKIAEFGDYFDTALPIDVSSKRLSISWQRANIHEKNTIVPFVNSLQVNFAGLNVTWEPLYSNRSLPYVIDNLFTKQEINLNSWNLNDFWMTSRGKIAVDLTHLHCLGMTKDEFITIAKREIERLRPSHIVYDGEYFILSINFYYEALNHHLVRQTVGHGNNMFFRLTVSFDERQADVPWLDESPLYVEHLTCITSNRIDYKLGISWSLDLFVNIGNRRIPLAGKEGDEISAIQSISNSLRHTLFDLEQMPFTGASLSAARYSNLTFNMHYRFDEYPSDSLPTNASLHGLGRTTLKSTWMGYQLGADWSLDLFVDIDGRKILFSGREGDKIGAIQAFSHSLRHTPFVLAETPFTGASLSAVRYPYLTFNMHYRFDEAPSDSVPTDDPLHGLNRSVMKPTWMSYQLGTNWSLDLALITSTGTVSVSGLDGDAIPPMKQHRAQLRSFQTRIVLHSTAQKKKTHTYCPITYKITYSCIERKNSSLPFKLSQPNQINLNPWLGFDEIPADFAPLDTPLWS
ncbi:hypothetical protein [Xenorhabdus sp. PB30.3]|uniref:hypothetical protein n=1 Tax=Xenorhabdus sp. PB30.3 TaxID=2788941 RepID=UPI001E31DF38|nr:hypothetical protein [Xenorhabdus sp. PB30.3]MCC8380451.1 hypothetical protein [Xenorhabdus sp. PB30.3]